ncbi:MAG TPA: hypothetical protein VJ508_03375 [Saprospiraceae bacterium]|nr:hypothetical protein [Saprospiraceae bacterium]
MNKSIYLALCLLMLFACKSSVKKDTPAPEPPPPATPTAAAIADSLAKTPETSTVSKEDQEKAAKFYESSKPNITAHQCDVNFTLLGKPKSNQQVFYITGFNPTEFKCWEELELHAVKQSNNQPGIVIYVDDPKIKINPALPDLIDAAALKAHGVGRFELKKFWEMSGARIWKREGKGYDYFDSNNSAGG